MSDTQRIALADVRGGRAVRILSIDPGARRPGFACLECWWGNDDSEWPLIKPLLLMGDPIISSEVQSVKKFGRIKCINALDEFFLAHGRELFRHCPDFAIVETQKGVNNRLVDSLSMVLYVTCRHAHKLFPEFCNQKMRVSMCPATWKTQGLGVPPGAQNYHKRKAACVKKANELLRENGFKRTAANLLRDEAKNDISDAFMQAVQFFMHTFPRQAKKRKRQKAPTKKKKAAPRARKRARVGPEEAIDLTASDDGENEASMTVELEGGMRMRCGTFAAVERLQQAVQKHIHAQQGKTSC